MVHPDHGGGPGGSDATLVIVGGTTATTSIDGISAAGAVPDLLAHTPSADLELVARGRPGGNRPVPVTPTGCPTPALFTRAVRDLVGFVAVDAGLKRPTTVPTIDVDAMPGGDLRDPEPVRALRYAGDPVLAAVAGLLAGATEAGIDVTLAGGTQLTAAAALERHWGIDAPLALATTSFVAGDGTAAIRALAADLGLELTVTDPGIDRLEHPAADAYVAGEAKEGVGMGGALALADRADVGMDKVRGRVVAHPDDLLAEGAEP